MRSPSVCALWFGWKPSFLCSTELGAERNLASSPPSDFLTGLKNTDGRWTAVQHANSEEHGQAEEEQEQELEQEQE